MSVRFNTAIELKSSPILNKEALLLRMGIPSTTYRGSLLALKEAAPRILIRSELPKLPEPVDTVTPATRPCSNSLGVNTGRIFDSLGLKELIALVTNALRCVPYPTTTTSLSAFESSPKVTLIVCCAFTGYSILLYPRNEKTKVALSGTSRLYLPFISVIVPMVVPLTDTLHPTMASPEYSFTRPVILFLCCTGLSASACFFVRMMCFPSIV